MVRIKHITIRNEKGQFVKGHKVEQEWKDKMSEATKGRKSHRKGITFEEEFGKEKADEIKKKSSDKLKGRAGWNKGLTKEELLKHYKNGWKGGFKKGHKATRGEKHPFWKGEEASLESKHCWVKRRLGTPRKCEHCGTTEAKLYDWANKDHKYRRVLSDWIRLCRKCHIKYDHENNATKLKKSINGKIHDKKKIRNDLGQYIKV